MIGKGLDSTIKIIDDYLSDNIDEKDIRQAKDNKQRVKESI